jgi:DNA-directed RNA polymerase subunit omega
MQSHLLEKAEKVIKNQQILVNVISRRVRQLSNGHRPLVEVLPRMGLSDIALTEVIEGKIGYEETVGFIEEPVFRRESGTPGEKYGRNAA